MLAVGRWDDRGVARSSARKAGLFTEDVILDERAGFCRIQLFSPCGGGRSA